MTVSIRPVGLAGIDVLAAGAVLWRAGADGPELAVVHRPRYDDWGFPKGKLDPGETLPVTAVREVAEETGYRCRLGALVGDVQYEVAEGTKLVRYWAGEARGGAFVPNHETDELRWLRPDAVAPLLSYDHDRTLLSRFVEIGTPESVLLLVRHAKAGSRAHWDGEDSLRPLSGSGRAQAKRLAELLPLFGPDRMYSAPPLRCRETVQPAADVLGLAIADEPTLGENSYEADPAAALARLRELAGRSGVAVVSSQGGVIPEVITTLATGRHLPGVDLDKVRSRKASMWVLTFVGAELRTADYVPDPTGN